MRLAAAQPALFRAIKSREKIMRRLLLWGFALGIASAGITATSDRSQAGLMAPLGVRQAADELRLAETVQFTWRGHRYCWYSRGWRGGGWYRCGFASRRGMGWGGPAGWHGWRRPGHRPVTRPPRPSRPGIERPRPLPQPFPGRS